MLSLRDGSLFFGSHLTLSEIVKLTYWLCEGQLLAIHFMRQAIF